MARIFVVDDDPGIREMLADYLTAAGHAVTTARDGRELDALVGAGAERRVDLFLLDVGLPGEDGFTLARSLRARFDAGIVMLTGQGELVDRVVGLEVGADDYLAKPVDLGELAARNAAVLRRRRPEGTAAGEVRFGAYRLDLRAFALHDAAGRLVDLSPMEVDLVAAFATNPGKVLSRSDLMQLAPPRGDDSLDRSIDHRVTRLRRKLEADPARPQLIKTVRGVGYVFPG
jgi:DNA-binding response OmpR family regulator